MLHSRINAVNDKTNKQMYGKNQTDTRTLPEIWKTLTPQQQEDLKSALIMAKAAKSRQAIYYWATGQRRPQSEIVRDRIAVVVSRIIGAKTHGKTLFPLV